MIKFALAFIVLWFTYCPVVSSATYINYTRLILNESEREVTFSVKNEGNGAVLMQLWTDRDDVLERPENIKMPFLIQPPVFRLNAQEARKVRLQFVGDPAILPADKESLFWLNVLEVPPKPNVKDNRNDNLLQVAFRTRIKIFYRPATVAKLSPESEVKRLTYSTVKCGSHYCIEMANPTPLHFTLLDITLNDGQRIKDIPENGMILPNASIRIPLKNNTTLGAQLVSFNWVDDYGVGNVINK